jgi:hypothetical protein
MNADLSDASSDSTDDLKSILRRTSEIPDDYSIDDLLASRERDVRLHLGYPSAVASASSLPDFQLDFRPPLELVPLVAHDANIFDVSRIKSLPNSFAFFDDPKRPDFPDIPAWQLQSLELFPASPNSSVLFSLIQTFIHTNSRKASTLIVRYASQLPDESIDFEIWLSFLLCASRTSPSLIASLLAAADFRKFAIQPDDAMHRASDLICLHFAAMLVPTVCRCQAFGGAVANLRRLLVDVDGDDDFLVGVADRCCHIGLAVPIQSLSLWVSFFPAVGCGLRLVYIVASRLSIALLGTDVPGVPTAAEFINALGGIRGACESTKEADLLVAAAVVALTERAAAAAVQLRIYGGEDIRAIARCLTVSFSNSDVGVMTILKEQLHATRAQVEMLSQAE